MSQLEEYEAVRNHAGLIDCSAWGVVEIRGADRIAFLHNLLTQDIKSLAPGAGCEAALVNPTAKLLADMIVLADADAHWLLIGRSSIETVLKALEHYLISEDVSLQDRAATHAILALQGPASRSVLQEAVGTSVANVPTLAHQMATIQEVPVRVITHSVTGLPGFLLVVSAEQAARLQDQLLEHGHAKGLRRVGSQTLNVLRLEAGIPWYGVDMDESNLLPETGLEQRAVSYTKGCFVGQEVIARLSTYGSVSRKLMGLTCEGSDLPQSGDPITKEGDALGNVTSACFSPTLNRPIALGYVKRPFYDAGTHVVVRQAKREIFAMLVKPPFLVLST